MHETNNYCVKDINLANQGDMNIEYAEKQMEALLKIRQRFEKEKPLKGIRIGMALHLTKETAALVKTLKAGGADVAICSCNPLSTQDDVAAALAKQGFMVYGYKGETTEDYYKFIKKVIEFKPNITIDDGCDLVSEIHKNHKELIKDIIGGCEETTTGVIRLRAMEKDNALKYPIIAVNDNKTKHLVDNYYGTGQSTMDGILRASNLLIAGSTVVVAGYGDCGKGFALRSKGLGAKVIVTEVNPFEAMKAAFDGFGVMPMKEAALLGDLFVTLTGDINVITLEHMKLMKDGAIVANSGHFDVEIDLKSLKKAAKSRRIRPFLDEYMLDGKRIYVAGEGRLVNLAAAEGHPSTVMSLSFCGQSLAVEYLIKNKRKLPIKVITLPKEIDEKISWLQLEAMNIKIDKLTEEQKKYLESWEEGT
ncbi:adenosylhomocysteinase [Candidatus Woesearchaeota archaeon CG06_land_8_20_14_3_00_33_13]|nr:MAG: adenosylhomocysteinase [Candidatus Woesearchaeota archaeon CG10_big_fil_rev_8_21_14_0_10_33_12]PIU72942.1 MAG: adenosylhomocysteinase [Candidatus Woesearchaeota archaeon CG06_land_8_20_14_3_00_33_13]